MILHTYQIEMGWCGDFDYSLEGGSVKDRLSRCYELAGLGVFFEPGLGGHLGVPLPGRLVHGRWSSPETRDTPINHAWLEMDDDGLVWEPITASLYEVSRFQAFTLAEVHHVYTPEQAANRMLIFGHFGPWE